MPQPDRPKRPGWLIRVAVLATLVVICTASFGVVSYIRSRSITVNGKVVLTLLQFSGRTDCEGTGGYSDIKQGTQVTALSPDGTILAVASLPAGIGLVENECDFDFSMKIPAGKGTYGFALAHRGIAVFTEQDVKSGIVALTVGA
jgi:hypothetical protein